MHILCLLIVWENRKIAFCNQFVSIIGQKKRTFQIRHHYLIDWACLKIQVMRELTDFNFVLALLLNIIQKNMCSSA